MGVIKNSLEQHLEKASTALWVLFIDDQLSIWTELGPLDFSIVALHIALRLLPELVNQESHSTIIFEDAHKLRALLVDCKFFDGPV